MSGRIRSVKPEWLEDELLVALSSDARVLSIALILLADDYGNGRGGELYLASRVFPGRQTKVLRAALDELVGMRYVALYEIEGQRYFSVRNWRKHQRVQNPGKPLVPEYAHSIETRNSPTGDGTEDRDRISVDSPSSGRPSVDSTETLRESTETLSPDRDRDMDRDRRPTTGRLRATSAEDLPNPNPEPDPGRETVCPLDLLSRPGVLSMLAELAERLPAPVADLEHEARDFLGYWTIGEGQGRLRTNWPRVLRERLRKRHGAGDLGAKPKRTGTHGGPSDEWPTDADLSLREAIRAGAHGPKLKARLGAGQLDAALARRLVREREAEQRERAAERAEGEEGQSLPPSSPPERLSSDLGALAGSLLRSPP